MLALEMNWDGLVCSLEVCELPFGNENSHPHTTSQYGSFGPASIVEVQRYMLGEYPGRLALEMKWDVLAISLEVCKLSLGKENSDPHAASQYGSFGPASILECLRHVLNVNPGRVALEMKCDGLVCSLEVWELSLGKETRTLTLHPNMDLLAPQALFKFKDKCWASILEGWP